MEIILSSKRWPPQLCHCDNRSDSWLSPITMYGQASIKESLGKWVTLKSSWAEFLPLCLFLHFWQDSWWVKLKIMLNIFTRYAINRQLVHEVTHIETITAGTRPSNSTSRGCVVRKWTIIFAASSKASWMISNWCRYCSQHPSGTSRYVQTYLHITNVHPNVFGHTLQSNGFVANKKTLSKKCTKK